MDFKPLTVYDIDISLLKPTEYNPKALSEKEANDLQESMETFGMVEPIVVNQFKGREYIIVGGHQRYYIAKDKLKLKTLPCVFVNLDIDQERELNLRLTKNTGHWNWDLLANFEQELLEKVGFDKYELSEIFDLALSKAEATAEAEANKREMVFGFDKCEDIDKAEKELKEVLDRNKIKYRIIC